MSLGRGENAESGALVSSVSSTGFIKWMIDRADRAKIRNGAPRSHLRFGTFGAFSGDRGE